MDPSANIKEQLQIAKYILSSESFDDDSYRLAELVVALNEWLNNGGFLPDMWKKTS